MNIKEIARLAGVSSATVSRVLNNSGYVKENTRQRVLQIVDKYNYVPSAIARNLSIQDNPNIGIIVPDIENEFFSKVINGISEVAESFNYNIVLLGTNETPEKEHAFLKTVESQRLKGVIIAPVLNFDPDYVLYIWTLHLDELFIFILVACAELILMIDQREFAGA